MTETNSGDDTRCAAERTVETNPEGRLDDVDVGPSVRGCSIRRCGRSSQRQLSAGRELTTTGVATTPEFPTITPHSLRHTAASLAISAGANVKAVQRMLGHAKASMTLDVYADLFDDDLDVVADRLDTAIKSGAASGRHRPNRECPTCGQSVVAEGGRPREAAIQSAADQLRTGSESLLSITPRPADTPARSS